MKKQISFLACINLTCTQNLTVLKLNLYLK